MKPKHTLIAHCLTLAACLIASSPAALADDAAAPNTLTAAEQAAGWKLLFDGAHTAGWRGFKQASFPAQGWVAEDGWLKNQARRGGDIVTAEEFDDFELQFEWRAKPGANSGVKYFLPETRGGAIGHEYQIWDEAARESAKLPAKGSTGALYDCLAPTNVVVRPPGQTNSSRIIVRGQRVEHWLNERKILEYELGSPALRDAVAHSKFKSVAGFGTKLKGHLLLQDHGGEVWFRNLKLRSPERPADQS